MTSYDGEDRRNHKGNDHDLLTRIDANLINFMKTFVLHEMEDRRRFDNIEKTLNWVMKIMYGCIGGVMLIEFVLRVVK